MSPPYPHLFSPIQLGRRTARNRVMRLATTANLGEGGRVSEKMLALFRRVAAGGPARS